MDVNDKAASSTGGFSKEEFLIRKLQETEIDRIYWLKRAKDDEQRRLLAEEQLAKLRRENFVLRQENCELEQRLATLSMLPKQLAAALEENKKLCQALNRRNKKEEPYGLSTPSSKLVYKKNSSEENRKKRGGGKVGHEGHGRQTFTKEEADRVVTLDAKPDNCSCGTDNDWKRHSVYPHCVINYIPARLEKLYYEKTIYRCEKCSQIFNPPTPAVSPGALYSYRTWANLMIEHYVYGHTIGSIEKRWSINHGTFCSIAHRIGRILRPLFKKIIQQLRKCFLVHADETPWGNDGAKGYAWFFGNDNFKVFIFRHTRSSAVPIDILGLEPLDMILVTDRYAGYVSALKALRQYCYVHLLRDIKEDEEKFKDVPEYISFAADLKPLLAEAIALRKEKLPIRLHQQKAEIIKNKIIRVCNRPAEHPAIQHHQNIFRENPGKLYQWTKSPDIPADNNFGEREIKLIVIPRKMSFGSQSEQGLETRETLMTVLHTAKAQGYDPAVFLENILNLSATDKNFDLSDLLSLKTDDAATA